MTDLEIAHYYAEAALARTRDNCDRLARRVDLLEAGVKLAIADLERIWVGMLPGVIAAKLARVTDQLRKTIAGEQEIES